VPPLAIAIAGFGIAGGTLAVLLARQGHRVTLFEQAPRVGPVGAGFLLQPSGQAVLARLGLLDDLAGRSERIAGLHVRTHRGHRLIDLGFSTLEGDQTALGVHRGVVFEAILGAAVAAGVEIVLDFPVAGWQETGGRVVVRGEGDREAGAFDLLVAADGARSRLRRQVDPAVRERDDRYAALWAVGAGTPIRGHLFQVTRGSRELCGLLPLGGGRTNFFWGLRAADWDGLRAAGFPPFRDRVLHLAPEAEELLDPLRDFDGFAFATYRHARPRRIHRGPVVLLGDAAHSTTPHLGQGANLALLDAESLANEIARGAGLAQALARYAAARRRQIRFYLQLSTLLSPFFQSDVPLLGSLRDLGLPWFPAIPGMRRTMEKTLAGWKRGWVG
jgi:2-polyprenyl-6-methoxyphenol hydroxylase-like FAD-dependent oxidoreductase